jgi:O-antigen/teichoic acid export membrane protein
MPSSIQVDQKFLVKSTLYTIFGTMLKVVSPLLTIVIARFFGKEAFGIYVSTQLWVLTLSRLAVLGLDKGLNWFIPQNKLYGRPLYLGLPSSLRWATLLATAMAALIILAATLGLHRLFSGLAGLSAFEISLYIISLVPWVWIHIFAGASEGNRKPQHKILINEFAVYSFAPIVSLILYAFGMRGIALPIGLIVANIAGAIAYLPLMKQQFPEAKLLQKEKMPKELFNYSLPFGVSEVITSLLMRVDLWMVLALLGPAKAGVYAVMVTISNGLRTIRASFNPILLPVVAEMNQYRLENDLKPVFTYCVMMLTMIQLAIGFFIVLFPAETMMIAGRDYVMQPEVLGILLLGNLVNGFFGLSGTVIVGLGKSGAIMKMNIVTLAIALVSNRLLIPLWGIAGAAISSALYQLVQSIWMNLYMVKLVKWPYGKALWAQGGWVIVLIALYIATFTLIELLLWQKIVLFVVAIAGLGITFLLQKETRSAKGGSVPPPTHAA